MPRSWNALVRDGKRAVAREQDAKWELGDLALEVEPKAKSGERTGSLERLEKYANEIGLEREALAAYRTVAAAWPASTRVPAASWSAHRELASQPDRAKYLRGLAKRKPPEGYGAWTVNAIREDRGKRPQRNGGLLGTRERAQRVVEELGDWGVVIEIAADPEKRELVESAIDEMYEAGEAESRATGGPTVADVIDDVPTPKERRRVERESTLHLWRRAYPRLVALAERMEEQGVERPADTEQMLTEIEYAEEILRSFRAAIQEHRSEARAANAR